ncbi:hypothetical protein AB205_0046410, partial [Aquarana catesbeiana]
FSKRTYVHSCAQEGTEKKQAASSSKGARKKSVQSTARRRSARNSKSDVGQLQSSPKSSNSDNDAPGCNSSSTNTLSTDHSNKPPAKQRKRAPKKTTQKRKRLRSATQTQREADESKGDSESESEKDEKKLKMPDLSDTTQFEVTRSPVSSPEKVYQPVEDHSSVLSPMDQSTKEHIPASPMQNEERFDKETSASPQPHNEHPFDKENSPPSPIFTNGQTALEKSQPESMCGSELDSDMVDSTKHLGTEVGHSMQAENLQVSEGECPGSPPKYTDVCFHKESASSDSENELGVIEKNILSSTLSEDIPDCMEQDYSDIDHADQALKEQPSQQIESAPMPVNMVQTQMNVVQQPMTAPPAPPAPPPQPVNIYPYSVGVHPPLVSMQHNPYNIHPPLPIHLHPPIPLVQVSAPSSVPQGLPPPPPPPPPSQQVGYVAPQQEVKPL